MPARVTRRTRRGLEDADEDEEECESAGSSNGKAVDAELELADGVWGTPAADGEDEASRSSFAEDDDDGSSDDREVTRKRAFQAYKHSHCIGPNLLVHEHAPVVALLAVLDLGHPNVEPPQSTSESPRRCPARRGCSSRSIAAAWIAPGETNIVFRSTFWRVVRRGHHARCLGLEELERRETEIFSKASVGTAKKILIRHFRVSPAGDGAGTMTSFGTASQSLGSGGRAERFLPTLPCPSPCVPPKPDLPTVQRLAQSSHVTSRLLNTEDVEAPVAAADADLLLGSTDESVRPFLPPDRTPSTTGTHSTGGDTASEPVLLQRRTSLQVELAVQPAQMAGQLRRNAEHVSGALAAGEKAGANLDVMKREGTRNNALR
ncbi:hypothetical protein EDB85DRAFT_2185258 [Lactarius pseudohatsudake]|nr:hypothetical protein EDB85DRAFT_2185258 [Lactarius pseudohatsudake]